MAYKTLLFVIFLFLTPLILSANEIKSKQDAVDSSFCPDLRKFDNVQLRKMEKQLFSLEIYDKEEEKINWAECDFANGDCYFVFGSKLCGFNVNTKESWTGYRHQYEENLEEKRVNSRSLAR